MIVGRRGERIVSPVSNVSMGEGSWICSALRTGVWSSRIKRGTEIGGGGVDSGRGGFRCLDSVSEGKRGMGIRLGRDSRGGWAEENCRTTPQVRTAHCLHILIS